MNRRGFLAGLITAPIAGKLLAAEEPLVYVPKRIYSLPQRVVAYSYPTHTLGYISAAEPLYGSVGDVYAELLAASLQRTKETLVHNILNECFGPGPIAPDVNIEKALEGFGRRHPPPDRNNRLVYGVFEPFP